MDIRYRTHRALPSEALSPQIRVVLAIMIDFMLDPASVNTLRQALNKGQPFDLIKMLAQCWSKGMSTAVDVDVEHEYHLSITVTKKFVEAVADTLLSDGGLSALNETSPELIKYTQHYLQSNQPLHVAWCIMLMWKNSFKRKNKENPLEKKDYLGRP